MHSLSNPAADWSQNIWTGPHPRDTNIEIDLIIKALVTVENLMQIIVKQVFFPI